MTGDRKQENSNADIFDRTADLRTDIPVEDAVNIVRESRDKGADVDRRELG